MNNDKKTQKNEKLLRYFDALPDRYLTPVLEPEARSAPKEGGSVRMLMLASVIILSLTAVLAAFFAGASLAGKDPSDKHGTDLPSSGSEDTSSVTEKLTEYFNGYEKGKSYEASAVVIGSKEELGEIREYVNNIDSLSNNGFVSVGSKEALIASVDSYYESDFLKQNFLTAVLTVEYVDGLEFYVPSDGSSCSERLSANVYCKYPDNPEEKITPYIVLVPFSGIYSGQKVSAYVGVENTGNVDVLRFKYPEAFSVDSSEGLDLYVSSFAEGSYQIRIASHPSDPDFFTLIKLPSFNEKETALILSTYNVPDSKIRLIHFQNILSSYIMMKDELSSLFGGRYSVYEETVMMLPDNGYDSDGMYLMKAGYDVNYPFIGGSSIPREYSFLSDFNNIANYVCSEYAGYIFYNPFAPDSLKSFLSDTLKAGNAEKYGVIYPDKSGSIICYSLNADNSVALRYYVARNPKDGDITPERVLNDYVKNNPRNNALLIKGQKPVDFTPARVYGETGIQLFALPRIFYEPGSKYETANGNYLVYDTVVYTPDGKYVYSDMCDLALYDIDADGETELVISEPGITSGFLTSSFKIVDRTDSGYEIISEVVYFMQCNLYNIDGKLAVVGCPPFDENNPRESVPTKQGYYEIMMKDGKITFGSSPLK